MIFDNTGWETTQVEKQNMDISCFKITKDDFQGNKLF